METNVLRERQRFVADFESGHWSMTELCERYGVSRPTGYKWVRRHRDAGAAGLVDRSRAPHHQPHRTSALTEARLVALRRTYGWGAKKLLQVLQLREPTRPWPARSTVNALLERHRLLQRHRRRRRWTHPGSPVLETTQPNQVWPADFKGHFKTADGRYCYPLTVTDHFSRCLLACQGLPAITTRDTQRIFRTIFRQHGLPAAIRTDNGAPFASAGLHGLCALNVWWMQLGIVHQRIRPGCPQQNGTHERMHRELKRETTRPAAASLRSQQRRFDAFQRRYNDERPHEGLGNRTPASLWIPSPRTYPERVPPPAYPGHMEIRRVTKGGSCRWHSQHLFLSHALAGHDVGFEEVDDGIWNIVFYTTLLGKFDERTRVITGL